MKLVYGPMGHILKFECGYVNELIIENRKMFFDLVSCIAVQIEGEHGECVLSISDKPVEISRYADLNVDFAPFKLNRKSLLTKLYSALEQKAISPEYYLRTNELLGEYEAFIQEISEDMPFEIECKKLMIGNLIRSAAPEIVDDGENTLEKIFSYMQLVRELDRDRLFIMVNMRTYFSDADMENFINSACLHDFRVLLIESVSFPKLKNTKRYTVDEDLCEF